MRRGLQKVLGGLKSLREPGSCLYCRPTAHEYCPPKTHYVFPGPAGLELLEFSIILGGSHTSRTHTPGVSVCLLFARPLSGLSPHRGKERACLRPVPALPSGRMLTASAPFSNSIPISAPSLAVTDRKQVQRV